MMRAFCCLLLLACSSNNSDVVVKMSDVTVAAGAETYKCQNFANPFGGAVDIDRFEAHMPAGVHHMIVFFVDDIQNGGLEDCSGSEFHGNVFGAQTPDSVIDLPAGIGVAVPAKTGLRFQLHFVNAADHAVTAGVTTRFHVAQPGSISQHAGQLIFSNEDISIPPTTTPISVQKTCTVPSAVSLLGASAHVHQHAVDFVAQSNGQELYHFAGGSEPTPARFNPPIPLAAGQGITWSCSYLNDTGTNLVFGESAVTNEMCVFGAIYYPVADVTFPNIPCF
jgi:Copper type II ascorbate-dependent monooxygenase, C-terminal domain